MWLLTLCPCVWMAAGEVQVMGSKDSQVKTGWLMLMLLFYHQSADGQM